MGALVSILKAGAVIVSFIVPAIETALQIKSHFELDPNYTVNVTNLSGDAIAADEGTIAAVNAWRKSVGLAPLPLPTPLPSAVPPAVAGN